MSPKGRRTRQRLLSAARTVFERDGFLAARVADIAAEAGVAHGTFYSYFESKTAVFRVLVGEVMTLVYDTGHTLADGDGARDVDGGGAGTAAPPALQSDEHLTPLERIERGNRQFVQVYREHGAMLALMEQAVAYDDEIREIRLTVRQMSVDRICRSIQRMQTQGEVRSDLDPACAAGALVSMVSNSIYFWLIMGQGDYDEELAIHTLTQLWAAALQMKTD